MGGEMPAWNALYASGSARKSSFLKRMAIARVPSVVIPLGQAGPTEALPAPNSLYKFPGNGKGKGKGKSLM